MDQEPLGKHIMQYFMRGAYCTVFFVWHVLPDTALGFLDLLVMDC